MDVSVIVPIYNVEEFLQQSLDSLNAQRGVTFEVILVDDGSTDGSGSIARAYAANHEGFRYYHKQNGGAGSARNWGVQYATGDYLAFADPDDLLEPTMYQRLVNAARRNKSDMALCSAVRMSSSKTWFSWLQQHVFTNTPTTTTIGESPQLIYDTCCWNKIFRTDFYNQSGVKFTEDWRLYQDIPPTLEAHCLAKSVSVCNFTGYYWRVREEGSLSATQRAHTLKNFYDRLFEIDLFNTFLHDTGQPKSVMHAWRVRQLDTDLMLFVNRFSQMEKEQVEQVTQLINTHIDEQGLEPYLSELNPLHRARLECVRSHEFERLARLVDFQDHNKDLATTERDGHVYVSLPSELFGASEADLTSHMFPGYQRCFVYDNPSKGGTLHIDGALYFRRVSMAAGEQSFTAYMQHNLTGETIPLPIQNHPLDWMNDSIGTVTDPCTGEVSHYDCDGYGFRITIGKDAWSQAEPTEGQWSIFVSYENRFCKGTVPLAQPRAKARGNAGEITLSKGIALVVLYTKAGDLVLHVRRPAALASGFKDTKGGISLVVDQTPAHPVLVEPEGTVALTTDAKAGTVLIDASKLAPGIPYRLAAEDANGELHGVLLNTHELGCRGTQGRAVVVRSLRNRQIQVENVGKSAFFANALACDEGRILLSIKECGRVGSAFLPSGAELCARSSEGKLYPLAKGTPAPNKLMNKMKYAVQAHALQQLPSEGQTYTLCVRRKGEVHDLYGKWIWNKRGELGGRSYFVGRNASGILELVTQ